VAIGSNGAGSFTEAAPSCSNDWFYVVRAFDVSGTGSQFVGDVDINHETSTSTKTKTTTVTLPGTATGAIAVPSATPGEGQVQGAETETANNGATGVEEGQPEGSVLGEMILGAEASTIDTVKNHPWLTILLVMLVLILGYFGYQYTKGKYDHPSE